MCRGLPSVGGGLRLSSLLPCLTERHPAATLLPPADTPRSPLPPPSSLGLSPTDTRRWPALLPRTLTGRHPATVLPPPSPSHRHPPSLLPRPLTDRHPTTALPPPVASRRRAPGRDRPSSPGSPSLLPRPLTNRHPTTALPPPSASHRLAPDGDQPSSLGLSPTGTRRRPSLLPRPLTDRHPTAAIPPPSASHRPAPDGGHPSSLGLSLARRWPSFGLSPAGTWRRPSHLHHPLTDTPIDPPSSFGLSPAPLTDPPSSQGLSPAPRPDLPLLGATRQHPNSVKTAVQYSQLTDRHPTTAIPPPSASHRPNDGLVRPLTDRHLATALPPPSPSHRHPDRPSLLLRPLTGTPDRPSLFSGPLTGTPTGPPSSWGHSPAPRQRQDCSPVHPTLFITGCWRGDSIMYPPFII